MAKINDLLFKEMNAATAGIMHFLERKSECEDFLKEARVQIADILHTGRRKIEREICKDEK